jgi:MFS transporter, ACS family, glucarate transporter
MIPSPLRPSGVRYGVLAFAGVLSMVTYLDRVCFGQVASNIQHEFGLTDSELGYLFSAFALAYAAFEVPSGWLGDVFGARRMLVRIVIWWSLFTALTGLVYPSSRYPMLAFLALLSVRFLFGMGEAGAYPTISRAFHSWFPFQERGFAQGTVWMAGRLAGGITPLLVGLFLIPVVGPNQVTIIYWRHIFWIFGGIGLLWCILFWLWYRDRPEEHKGVNPAELELIHSGQTPEASHYGVPWLRILGSGNLWLLCLMYFCGAYGWYFNITWLPKYLAEHYHVPKGTVWSSVLAGAPLLFGSLACIVGGLLTDWFIRRTGNRKWGRRLFGVVGHGLCAVCYAGSMYARSPWLFVLGIALAAFWNDITMGSAWASCIDIGRRYSGIVSGCMNTIGNLGGFAAGMATGWVLDLYAAPARTETASTVAAYVGSLGTGNMAGGIGQALGDLVPMQQAVLRLQQATNAGWQANFFSYTAVYIVATICWLFFDASRPVTGDEKARPLPDEPSTASEGPTDHSTGIRDSGRYHEGS